MTEERNPKVIFVKDGMNIEKLFFTIHGVLNNHNKAFIRTLYKSSNVGIVYGVCQLMEELGYIEPIKKKEIVVKFENGSKINNLQFEIELLGRFHKYNDS